RISSSGLPKQLKSINRVITNASLASVLILYPLLRGQSPVAYFGSLFPLGRHPLESLHGYAAVVLYLSLIYLAWVVTGNIRFELRSSPGKLLGRLATAPFSAVLGATIEELMFRGVVLASLMQTFAIKPAVIIGTLIF